MKKSDLILAQKTLAARHVKEQSKAIRELKNAGRSSEKLINSSSQLFASQKGKLSDSSSLPTFGSEKKPAALNRAAPGPPSTLTPTRMALSDSQASLLNELSQRSTTDKTHLRKIQQEVARSVVADDRPQTTGNQTVRPPRDSTRSVDDQNYFMPKRKILRPDGATLLDVYESKKGDMWGQIIKAQYKEDEVRKVQGALNKEASNKAYGDLLKRQVEGNEMRKSNALAELNNFAQIEGATAKRYEDLERSRMDDAARRHKQFIDHAMEDIELKRNKREKELTEELTASVIMVNHAKELIAQEEAKRQREKEYQKSYQERIFQENLDDIARKQRLKEKTQAEDKRIIEESERQYQREKARREQEFNAKMIKSSEGPAHHVFKSIVQMKNERDNEFFRSLERGNNTMNDQLRMSEQTAAARARANGQSLNDEWVINTRIREEKKKAEEERNNMILETMRAMLAQQEADEIARKQQRREAAVRYQQELDSQVRALRQRSIESLTKTMSDAERSYNRNLIQKSAKFL